MKTVILLTVVGMLAGVETGMAQNRLNTAKDGVQTTVLQKEDAGEKRKLLLTRLNSDPSLTVFQQQQRAEWIFQAEGEELANRVRQELDWTEAMVKRLESREGDLHFTMESAALKELRERAQAIGGSSSEAMKESLYFEVRALKRQVMLKFPEVDFSSIACIDSPYPFGPWWMHESRYRSEMEAVHGARLLILDNVRGELAARQLAPPREASAKASMFSFDLSFDAQRLLFSMKSETEKAFHIYEIGVDGQGLRQVTFGNYSDLDPIYLPDGGYLFLSTRAEVYAICGPWARSYIQTRCDVDGKNVYILSPGTEPEYSPSVMDDGRILFTRWEYVDKFANRIQALWSMRPDGSAMYTYWGNQTVIPDHIGEARQIPGTGKVMFTGFGHHQVYHGCIGVIDHKEGLNFPKGIWKVTQEQPWPEVGDGKVPTPGLTERYHTSGKYAAYKSPYPLSPELFLVSARAVVDRKFGHFKLYLMDIYGNRELLYVGEYNILYAQPVRARKRPAVLPALTDRPGTEKDKPVVRPGVFYSDNIFESTPAGLREKGKYLRVIESMPKNYSIGVLNSGGKPFGCEGPDLAWGSWAPELEGRKLSPKIDLTEGPDRTVYSGPATTLTGPLSVKQVLGTVPINPDGSVSFKIPPCRMLYFQILDENYRCLHTMRSWVSARPGEVRGCMGCHELHNGSLPMQPVNASIKLVELTPPPWGMRSLSYMKDIQPIFDRACGGCHQGTGKGVEKLDLTLRPDKNKRWGGVFPEPYITLLLGKDSAEKRFSNCPQFSPNNYVSVPATIYTRYDTLPAMSILSVKSLLITEAMDKNRCGSKITAEELQKLIAWIDLWAMYRSDEECRAIEDPPAEWFPLWAYPPKTKSAPRIRVEYSQDEYRTFEDRLSGNDRP